MTGYIYMIVDGRRVRYAVWVNEELRQAIINFGEGNLKLVHINADNEVYWNGVYYKIFDE